MRCATRTYGIRWTAATLLLAVVLVLLALLMLPACGGPSTAASPRSTAPTAVAKWTEGALPSTPTPSAGHLLPTFSDWRAAYLAADGLLHVITLDGKTDLAGPQLPGMDSYGLIFASAGISPNGHLLAYDTNSLSIVEVTGRRPVAGSVGGAYTMFWSPDGAEIALGDNVGGFSVARAADGSWHVVPGTRPSWYYVLDGWIDTTHLLIDGVPKAGTFILGSLDVVTGQLRQIASLPTAQNVDYFVTLSPDGREALFYNQPYRDYPFTPAAAVIDTATGAVRALPRIAPLTAALTKTFAWRPGTHTVAVSPLQPDLRLSLINVDNDSATSIVLDPSVGLVAGWSPDGTTLVFSTDEQFGVGAGPYRISAVRLAPTSGAASVTLLTRSATSFPFIGFVRTA
jgi:WD40-like Beta Propeller Repeat